LFLLLGLELVFFEDRPISIILAGTSGVADLIDGDFVTLGTFYIKIFPLGATEARIEGGLVIWGVSGD